MSDMFTVGIPRDEDLVLERRLQATPGRVWDTWMQPEQLASWFGPVGTHVDPQSVVIEEKVGGRWELDMVDDSTGEHFPLRAVLKAVARPHYLEGRAAAETGMGPLDDISLRVWISADDGHCLLTIHQGPFTDEQREATRGGWTSSFGKLDELLARG